MYVYMRLAPLTGLLAAAVLADYVNHHKGCEPWCTAPNCNQFAAQCSTCTFCKGPQRSGDAQPERTWAEVSTNRTAPKVRFEGSSTNMTHYWDCCKPSCGWDSGQGKVRVPLQSMCDERGIRIGSGVDAPSACDDAKGRGVTVCPDMAPFFDLESRHWFGFVATQDMGTKAECCDCYKLKFENTSVQMVVQVRRSLLQPAPLHYHPSPQTSASASASASTSTSTSTASSLHRPADYLARARQRPLRPPRAGRRARRVRRLRRRLSARGARAADTLRRAACRG